MDNYNFGKVNIEFNTNKIFLLMQMLYRMDSLESNIHANEKVSYLSEYLEEFKKVVEDNKQGLEEFNLYKDNAENKNMWAEYGEYAVEFTIPTEKEKFEEMFEMEYTEGIESVILFHEKLHADLPTQSNERFINYMQREVDSHLKRSIIELLANGEMGVKMADHSSYFQSVFHIGKIPYGNRVLTTNDLQELGMKDNELLHTEARGKFGEYSESFSKNEMGIIKIRGMMYPYVLMYNNRNNDNQLENVVQAIQRDSSLIEEIYGREFLEKIQDKGFLQSVQQSVKPYDSILEFAEGMSKELLGIEQVKDIKKNRKR